MRKRGTVFFGFAYFIFFTCAIFLIFGSSVLAAEKEDFESAKALYDSLDQAKAQIAFQDFLSKYQQSNNYSIAMHYDIMCDYNLKNDNRFLSKLEEFRSKYPNHPLLDKLDYFKGRVLRRQKKWEESKAFFQEYITKYKNSSYRQLAEELIGESQIELSRVLDTYWKKDYPKARLMISDFLTSYPTHSRADELLFRKADCLYCMEQFDNYMIESQELINQNPRRKYAYMLLYLQSAVLVRQEKGPQAREILKLLKNQYSYSDFYKPEQLEQMKLESYLYNENYKDLPSVESEWKDIEELIPLCTKNSIERNNLNILKKNIQMSNHFYSQIPEGNKKRLDFYRFILSDSNFHDKESFAIITSEIITCLGENGLYEEAENMSEIFFDSKSQLKKESKDLVLNALVKIYIKKAGSEAGAEIYRKYQKYL